MQSLRSSVRSLRHVAVQSIGPIFGITFFIVALFALRQKLMFLHAHSLFLSIGYIHQKRIIAAIVFTCLDYFILTSFDSLAVKFICKNLQYSKVALTSFLCYAFGHNIGFSLLSGSAIRYRLYREFGLSIECITKVIGFCTLTFWLGFLTVGSFLFLFRPLFLPPTLHLPFENVQPIGFAFLVILVVFILWNVTNKKPMMIGKWQIPELDTGLITAQIAVASLELLLSASVLYSLLPPGLPFLMFFGVFLLAQLSGLASQVPGGIGVFESVILFLLPGHFSTANIIASLIMYRTIYYICPLILAIVVFGVHEGHRYFHRKKKVATQ